MRVNLRTCFFSILIIPTIYAAETVHGIKDWKKPLCAFAEIAVTPLLCCEDDKDAEKNRVTNSLCHARSFTQNHGIRQYSASMQPTPSQVGRLATNPAAAVIFDRACEAQQTQRLTHSTPAICRGVLPAIER